MNSGRLVFTVLLAMFVSVAAADTREAGGALEFFDPSLPWKLSFAKSDWSVGQEKRKPGGGGYYYLATSDRLELNFSVFFDRTSNCSSGESCRALFWRNPGPMYKDPKNVKQFDLNGFSVLQFHLDSVAGVPIKQTNISAHMYKDGYWIDIHLSKVGPTVPSAEPMVKFLESIAVK